MCRLRSQVKAIPNYRKGVITNHLVPESPSYIFTQTGDQNELKYKIIGFYLRTANYTELAIKQMCENHFGDSSLIPIFLLWVLDQLRSSVPFFSVRFHLQNKTRWVT